VAAAAVAGLPRALAAAGVAVARMEGIEPALEDAFVALIARQGKGR